jgi:4-aminobutyrate aminotransferase
LSERTGDSGRGESEVNLSPRRQVWQDAHLDEPTRQYLAEDARYFLHQSVSTPCLSAIRCAEGIWIEDTAGRRYMDFHGNNAHHIGYGHPRLIAAIKQQLDELPFAPRRFTCEPAIDLARKLVEISPPGLDKALFATGGSDAVEIALKIARAATGRFKTVSFWDSFHGAGFGAAGIGGEALFRSGPIGPLLPGTEHVAPFACYRCPYGYPCDDAGQPRLELCRLTCARFVRYVLEQEGDVAAVIAEPARAAPYIPPHGFWAAVRQTCNEQGTLLIFDEIPTGLGKTGRLFACEHDEVTPDILVLGKALGGGVLPIAAVLARADLDVGGHWAFGHYTHEKNPVTCCAALTTLEIIEDEGLVENARRQGEQALQRLRDMQTQHPLIGDVRGRGLLLGVELVRDREYKTPANGAAEAVLYRALTQGLSFKISLGNVLTLTPPLTMTTVEMDTALDILEDCITAVERAAAP